MKNKPHLLTKKGLDASSEILITDVSKLIDQTKNQVAREYNSTQIQLCWLSRFIACYMKELQLVKNQKN